MSLDCGKHAPAKPGLCPRHNTELHELHDEELKNVYGVEAIFYCPMSGCDEFDIDSRVSPGDYFLDQYTTYLKQKHTPNAAVIIEEIAVGALFVNAVRLKVLYHLRHEQSEKAKKLLSE